MLYRLGYYSSVGGAAPTPACATAKFLTSGEGRYRLP